MITVKEEFLRCDKTRRALQLGGAEAVLVWLALKGYCSENLTDGFIPYEDVDALVDNLVDSTKRESALAALVDCGRMRPDGSRGPGLLERGEFGWQLHDYLDHCDPADIQAARRRRATQRQQRWRRNRNVTPPVDGDVDAPVDDPVTPRARVAARGRTRSCARDPQPSPAQPSQAMEDQDLSDPSDPPQVDSRPRKDEGIDRVFEHWKAEHDHPRARLDEKRRGRIRSRLKRFTVDQLCAALTRAKLDPFLMGDNKHGRRYDGIETLLRDDAQVERLLELGERGPNKRPPSQRQSHSDAQVERQLDRVFDLTGGDPYQLVGPQRRLPA